MLRHAPGSREQEASLLGARRIVTGTAVASYSLSRPLWNGSRGRSGPHACYSQHTQTTTHTDVTTGWKHHTAVCVGCRHGYCRGSRRGVQEGRHAHVGASDRARRGGLDGDDGQDVPSESLQLANENKGMQ